MPNFRNDLTILASLRYDIDMNEPMPENATLGFGTPEFAVPSEIVSNAELQQKFREQQQAWHPRTKLGQRLKELRQEFVAAGGRLLSESELEKELRERRGRLHYED